MKKSIIVLVILFITNTICIGQYSNKNWVFGVHAGLNFNQLTGGYPTAFSGSQLDTEDGVACISDENGNLLFYTDGINLYDFNNVLLSSSLNGSNTSTQSAICVPYPGLINNTRDYYIFTVDAWGACSWTNPAGHGIYYSVVNVNFNNPVTVTIVQQNIPLETGISFRENLMAVSKLGSAGYWVISKEYAVNNTTGSNSFYVWEVTSSGVNSTPQIYNVGSVQSTGGSLPGNPTYNGSLGYLKISPDGSVLAMANNYFNSVELYRFNTATGAVLPFVTTGNTILSNITRAYGVEFSPNNQLLYVSRTYDGHIYQFDLSNPNNVANSMLTIFPTITGTVYIKTAIQLGPDNKIYIVKYNSDKLAVINDPNVIGNGCNLVDNAVTLSPGTLGQCGLPTFVPTRVPIMSANTINSDEKISVFPNPCSTLVNFDYPGDVNLMVCISTTDNKIVLTKNLSNKRHEINIESLPDAIYFLKISVFDKSNKLVKILNQKIVKIS